MSKPIVLPADVYDTLEFSALVYGGIGGGMAFDYEKDPDATGERPPLCVIGHLSRAAVGIAFFPINAARNDGIVEAINARLGHSSESRVTWKQYVREGNIVRGAA